MAAAAAAHCSEAAAACSLASRWKCWTCADGRSKRAGRSGGKQYRVYVPCACGACAHRDYTINQVAMLLGHVNAS
jgi:hypothetical protein